MVIFCVFGHCTKIVIETDPIFCVLSHANATFVASNKCPPVMLQKYMPFAKLIPHRQASDGAYNRMFKGGMRTF